MDFLTFSVSDPCDFPTLERRARDSGIVLRPVFQPLVSDLYLSPHHAVDRAIIAAARELSHRYVALPCGASVDLVAWASRDPDVATYRAGSATA
jgi:hypothetical protein